MLSRKMTREPEYISKDLLNSLRECRLIGIDGASGSGKTTLAKELIQQIGGTHIDVDDHLQIDDQVPTKKQYFELVKFDDLKQHIENSKPPIIIVCFILMDVLQKLGIKADAILFCERDSNLMFSRTLEVEFRAYEKRHNPQALAKQIFTLTYPN
jgi:ABC-type dipeptide/oligopeptide/nickel transport system ATPase subunit